MTTAVFSRNEIETTQYWIKRFSSDWRGEVPRRIHEGGRGNVYGLGSSPPFAPEFIGYIGYLSCKNPQCDECRSKDKRPVVYQDGDGYRRNTNERTRTTKAFRKLRRAAPIEFDVLYMICQMGFTTDQIVIRLNDRAASRGLSDRYSKASVAVLAVAGIDKVSKWY